MNSFDETYKPIGRPPRKPKDKVGQPVRCLVTPGIRALLDQLSEIHGVSISDVLRLALYRHLKAAGLLETKDVLNDATWDELKKAGLV